MPYKRYKKKAYRKHKQAKYTKKAVNKNGYVGNDMILYKGHKMQPFPSHFRTTFTTAISGFVNSAGNPVSGIYYAGLNYCHIPFNGGGWPNSLPAIATLQPTGYFSIANSHLYTTLRVLDSRLKITFIPTSLTDAIEASITPSTSTSVPGTVPVALSYPRTKSTIFRAYSNDQKGRNQLSNRCNQHQLLGVSKRAIDDDLSGNYTHAYNGNPLDGFYWIVNWCTVDQVGLANNLEFVCQIEYDVDCYYNTAANWLQT